MLGSPRAARCMPLVFRKRWAAGGFRSLGGQHPSNSAKAQGKVSHTEEIAFGVRRYRYLVLA